MTSNVVVNGAESDGLVAGLKCALETEGRCLEGVQTKRGKESSMR